MKKEIQALSNSAYVKKQIQLIEQVFLNFILVGAYGGVQRAKWYASDDCMGLKLVYNLTLSDPN